MLPGDPVLHRAAAGEAPPLYMRFRSVELWPGEMGSSFVEQLAQCASHIFLNARATAPLDIAELRPPAWKSELSWPKTLLVFIHGIMKVTHIHIHIHRACVIGRTLDNHLVANRSNTASNLGLMPMPIISLELENSPRQTKMIK